MDLFGVVFLLLGGLVGLGVNAAMGKRRPWPLFGAGVGGALVGVLLGAFTAALFDLGEVLLVIIVLGSTGGSALAAWLLGRALEPKVAEVGYPPRAVGVTAQGEPVYAVVGYTADGRPVTADRMAPGAPMYGQRTNTLAIIALIMGFVFAPAAIPLGHVARSQIRRTGEQGDGMALAGLILGYVFTALGLVYLLLVARFLF